MSPKPIYLYFIPRLLEPTEMFMNWMAIPDSRPAWQKTKEAGEGLLEFPTKKGEEYLVVPEVKEK